MENFEPNSSVLIENNYFPRLLDYLHVAQKSIFAIIYYAKIHQRRRQDDIKKLCQLLIDKHKNNVKVWILFNFSSQKNFITVANKEVARILLKSGILVKHTDTNRVTHAKLFLIDDTISILGSHNLSTRSLHSNREISIVTQVPKINKRLTEYFLQEFYKASDKW